MAGELVPRPVGGQIDKTFKDFKTDRALGRASLYQDIAEVAAAKICSLYGKSPATVVRTIPFGTGLIDNSKGIFDDLCEDLAPPPAPPAPQFTGGQCNASKYSVTLSVVSYSGVGAPYAYNTRTDVFVVEVWGAIGGSRMATPAVSDFFGTQRRGYKTVEIFSRGNGANTIQVPGWYQFVGQGAGTLVSCSITNVSPLPGFANNCGNPAPSYPPPSAIAPDLEGTAIIQVSPSVSVTVPVNIVPVFAPVIGIFRPEFNVNVGGINVNISGGGFTFSPTVEIAPNVNTPSDDPRITPPPALPIGQPSSGTCPDVDLTPAIDKLDELLARPEPCECVEPADSDDPKYINKTTSSGSLRSGSISLPRGTYKVRTLLTVQPGNVKSESGDTQADVIYAGWGRFRSAGSLGDRQPIDAESVQFIPPNNSQDTFTWVCRLGHEAVCTVYYKEEQP